MSIYIGEPVEVSDMQGPCPDGFHVPNNNEWSGIITIMNGLSLTTGADYVQKLHIPIAGNRQNNSTADVYNVGTLGYYWCSTPNSGNSDYFIIGDDSSGASVDSSRRCLGFTIRPFKNEFVIPDSSWTVVQGTLGGAGIFWNQTDGLISITSNGTTGYTIADKNLGATTVYTRGDTRSESNCGKYYQRGNNYGFPFSGSVTTSNTRVSTSIYGPGNYYNSSTFIYYTSGNRDWSNPANDNLRGGVSQGTSTKSVEVQNIYIGEYKPPYEGPLRFTANTAGSYLALTKHNSPASVSLEISTDGKNWSPYTIGSYVNFSNIGDTVAFRNTSTTNTTFSTNETHYYNFYMSGSISADGDVSYLLNKNGTNTLSNNCFNYLFYQCSALTTPPQLSATTLGNFCYGGMFYLCTNLTTVPTLPATTLAYGCYNEMFNECSSLTTAPSLPATTLAGQCYMGMFANCSNLETIPALPATTLTDYCYMNMFRYCSKIKLSTSQTGEYQTAYRIPTTGTGTDASNAMGSMFSGTGGSWKGAPTINTTYYTSNTVV